MQIIFNRTNTPTTTHPVFGSLGAPTIPDYIVVDTKGFKGGVTADSPEADPSRYSIADYGNIHQILKDKPWNKLVQVGDSARYHPEPPDLRQRRY